MALSGEALIEDGLFRHIATLTTTPATTLAWPNKKHGNGKPRIEVSHAPNTTRGATLKGGKEYTGFLIATVVIKEGQGTTKGSDIASQVISHFVDTIHTTEQRIRFVQPASVAQPIMDGSDVRFPISIPYIATE